jgi:hypothetical protein
LNPKEWDQGTIERGDASEFAEENQDGASERGEEEEGAEELIAAPTLSVNPESILKKKGK